MKTIHTLISLVVIFLIAIPAIAQQRIQPSKNPRSEIDPHVYEYYMPKPPGWDTPGNEEKTKWFQDSQQSHLIVQLATAVNNLPESTPDDAAIKRQLKKIVGDLSYFRQEFMSIPRDKNPYTEYLLRGVCDETTAKGNVLKIERALKEEFKQKRTKGPIFYFELWKRVQADAERLLIEKAVSN